MWRFIKPRMKSVNTESDVLAALLPHYHVEKDGVELFGMVFFMIVKASVRVTFISSLRRRVICCTESHGTLHACMIIPCFMRCDSEAPRGGGGGGLLWWTGPVITKSISAGDLCTSLYAYRRLTFSDSNSWSDLTLLLCRQNTPLWTPLPSRCPLRSCSTSPQSLGFPLGSSFSCHLLTCPFSMITEGKDLSQAACFVDKSL